MNRAIECPEFFEVHIVHVGETDGFVPLTPELERSRDTPSTSSYPHARRHHFRDGFLIELRDLMESNSDEPHLMPPIRFMNFLPFILHLIFFTNEFFSTPLVIVEKCPVEFGASLPSNRKRMLEFISDY